MARVDGTVRFVVAVGVVLALTAALGMPAAQAAPAEGPLRAMAAPTGRYIGSAAEISALRDDAAYTAVSDREFDMLTPTNVLKWDATEPEGQVHLRRR